MTEEVYKQAMAIKAKINYAKGRINHFSEREDFWIRRFRPDKAEYHSKKIKEWTATLDGYRLEFKNL